jgi:hypothetical protein
MRPFRPLIVLVFALRILPGLDAATAAGHPYPLRILAKGRQTDAVVAYPAGAERIRESAVLLAAYLKKSSGAELKVLPETNLPQNASLRIHVGPTSYTRSRKLDLDELGGEGYVLDTTDGGNFIIAGATDTGTEFGVYSFLERHLGVRWLFPGEIGEHVPPRKTIAIEPALIRQKPAFLSRLLSPFRRDLQSELYLWGRRNRMNEGLSFHHNLHKLVPPDTYRRSHPEFYPLVRGNRIAPAGNVGWQPCFTADGIVGETVRNICEYLERNPDAKSFSLGANDGSGYCGCSRCAAVDGTKINALGIPSKSESYYSWCNRVAEGVLEKYPGRNFGLLAYVDVIEPPRSEPLHPRITPYICLDRMAWLHEDIEKRSKLLNEAWEKRAGSIGWYDYIYGCRYYLVPRVYFHHMAEYIRYGFDHKVRHYYAEAYPSPDWIEGPKLYLLLKLLWEPQQDVDGLLKEWSECCVGREASVSLLAYFRLWEEFWEDRVPTTDWFLRSRHKTFLPFRTIGYLEALSDDDVRRAQALLESCVRDAGTDEEGRRARFLLAAFLKRKERMTPLWEFFALNGSTRPYRSRQIIEQDDFSHDANGWKPWQRPYSRAKVAYSRAEGQAKPGALAIDAQGSHRALAVWTKDFPFEEKRLYAMSVWYKNAGLPPEADARMTLKWKDGEGRPIDRNRAEGDIPFLEKAAELRAEAGQWGNLRILFRGPAGARFANVVLSIENADRGTVYFDDFVFEEVSAE